MKLRTSFFNPTVFKKDLTRFAPTWVLYTIALFMMMAICLDAPYDYRKAQSIADTISFMAAVNLCYGLLNAQLLFGDLFNSRHVNALHAMPLRRETVFLTNAVSGLLFSLGPTAVMALLSMPLLAGTIVHNAWQIGLLWFVGVNLEFLCFFGIVFYAPFTVSFFLPHTWP